MNVLSLFDGISCGQVALERAGIKVDNYYASEIDKYAIQVTQANYPNTIQLGDIKNWKNWDITWNKIDLLFAGFPCQSWSIAGKEKGIEDSRGQLMWDMLDILHHIKKQNPNIKFLFENVKMKKEFLQYVNQAIGVTPIEINSSLVSAQNRKRLYWTNINNKKSWFFDVSIPQPKNTHQYWNHIVQYNATDVYYLTEKMMLWINKDLKRKRKFKIYQCDSKEKMQMLEASHYKGISNQRCFAINDVYGLRYIAPIECERLQTLPDNYTAGISRTQRYKALGNGWTVDIIVHILGFINN